jgi:thioredoxin:protein disulfide reductase
MRVRLFRSTVLPAFCGLICLAQAVNVLRFDPPPPLRAKIGATVEAKVPLSLQEGYHVNSNTPSDSFLIPLTLTWSKGVLEPAGVVYPKPRLEKYQFSPDKLSVFSGSFELVAKFTVPAGAAAGPAAMNGKLRYQACNDKMCLAPKNMDVALQVDIVK